MVHDYSRGMHWIGHPGSLLPIVDYGSESPTYDVRVAVTDSMSGAQRVRVPRNRPGRTWQLSIPNAHADDIAHVETLLTSTLPPYQLVTAGAQVSNVLTPERSTLGGSGLAMGGWWPIAGQYQGGGALARLNPNASFNREALVQVGPCPIPPMWTGRAVTVSAQLATGRDQDGQGARVVLQWLDATGSWLSSEYGNHVTGKDGLRRSTATGTPPAGAAACMVAIQYAEVIAQPQVTWTDAPIQEWSVGRGADRVVITGWEHDTELAVPDQYALRRGDYTLSLMEPTP